MSKIQTEWLRQPLAEKLIDEKLEIAIKNHSFLKTFEKRLFRETSTRVFDWIDHIQVRKNDDIIQLLNESGFEADLVNAPGEVYYHPGAMLPRVVVTQNGSNIGIAIKVEQLSSFMLMNHIAGEIHGSPFTGFRRVHVGTESDIAVYAVERRGTRTLIPVEGKGDETCRYFQAQELWATRPRDWHDEDAALQEALVRANKMNDLVGGDLAAHILLEVERNYWQMKNTAGTIQKMRQDRLGLGWANQDHHTFRNSRKHFSRIIEILSAVGFKRREKFYAGEQAGWGAQVMENPISGHVIFLDVDLAPHEVEIDIASESLPELENLGTIGLWCALHGDSMLQAGLHHLEAQFEFEQLSEDLEKFGIKTMEPFSDFSYLKQAFTQGERWAVSEKRIQDLLEQGKINKQQAEKFMQEGAIGSHLENLQRREGFKGFNQQNVSDIIKKTDPRTVGQVVE